MWFLQGLAGVLGGVLLCYVLFSHEDEEKKVKSWLDEAWVALDDKNKEAPARIRGFLQRLCIGVLLVLRRIYGSKMLSLSAFLSAYLFCVVFATCAWFIYLLSSDLGDTAYQAAQAARILVPLLPAAYLLLIKHRKRRNILAIIFLAACSLAPECMLRNSHSVDELFVERSPALSETLRILEFLQYSAGEYSLAPAIAEFISIAITRYLLTCAKNSSGLLPMTALVAVASIAPLFFALAVDYVFSFSSRSLFLVLHYPIGGGIDLVNHGFQQMDIQSVPGTYYSMWAATLFCALFAVGIFSIIGRLIYFILPRVTYSLIKHKVLENRKASLAIAVVLLGVAMPKTTEIIEKLAKGIVG